MLGVLSTSLVGLTNRRRWSWWITCGPKRKLTRDASCVALRERLLFGEGESEVTVCEWVGEGGQYSSLRWGQSIGEAALGGGVDGDHKTLTCVKLLTTPFT